MKKIIKKWKLFYKKGIAGLLILSLTSLSMAGCGKTMGIDSGASVDRISKVSALSKDKQQLISKIAANVRAKRAAGFLAQIPAELYKMPANPNSAANEVSASDNESVGQKLEEFYTEPEKALTEMAGEEKGQEQLELVDAIYSEQTADIVADKMEQLDLKMKEQYVSNLEKMADSSSEIQAQF